jgi:hypothetical protein
VIFTFPYQREPGIDPSPAAPDQPVFRPKIPLRLIGPHGDDALTFALVDSGADDSVVPLSLARPLRVRLDSKVTALYGANDRPVLVRYALVDLVIGRGEQLYRWQARVGFQERRRYSVLGRAGCLDLLNVAFDGPGRQIVITTPDPEGR